MERFLKCDFKKKILIWEKPCFAVLSRSVAGCDPCMAPGSSSETVISHHKPVPASII